MPISRHLPLGGLLALALLLAVPAYGQAPKCGEYEAFAAGLHGHYGEVLIGRGLDDGPDMVEVWAHPSGVGWTIITVHRRQGRTIACSGFHGDGLWMALDGEPPEPPETSH